MMTEGEKMVWAAVYAADYTRQLNDRRRHCTIPQASLSAIENAWYAVEHMRKSRPAIADGWSNDSVLSMLDEILGE